VVNGCTTQCKRPTESCGDGVINGPDGLEKCDDKERNSAATYFATLPTGVTKPCSKTCTLIPFCGDRTVQSTNGEECDEGRETDTCESNCREK
jgi:hypothetical protein